MPSATPKIICFDFDGTIADTRHTFVAITNRLAPEYGYTPITEEKLAEMGTLNLPKIIRNSEIALYKIPFLIRRLKRELTQEMKQIVPIDGIPETLHALKQEGHTLKIITSNAEENVQTFLVQHNLQHFFDSLNAGVSLNGKHRVVRRLIRQNRYRPTSVIYVGDEVRDIKAARKTPGVVAIAVSWGFHSRTSLTNAQPDFLLDHPQDLVSAVGSLSTSPV